MSDFLPNHYITYDILKHKTLPIFLTAEFDFYRCVPFNDMFYGKTVSELHQGNLRSRQSWNRYSMLFSGEKVSYWADSKKTAYAEMQKHGQGHNLLTFFAYDDATASFPTLTKNRDVLKIIDGRVFGFHEILEKDDNGIPLSKEDKKLISRIEEEKPDCLAYWSVARKGGVNFLFFEKGFRKLAIRELRLRLGDEKGKNKNCIYCAGTCDYKAWLKAYGDFFVPKARIRHDSNYELSKEFLHRKEVNQYWYNQYFKQIEDEPHITIKFDAETGEVKIEE